jgi:membrane protein YdbS with pleckstrin-like domain
MSDERPCPACAEPIKVAATKCRFCGEDLAAYAVSRSAGEETTLFKGHPAVFFSLAQYVWAILTVGIAAIVYWVRAHSLSYEITTQRLKIEKGWLSKNKQNLELFRVDHVGVVKPIGMRLVGHGYVALETSDSSERHVDLYGLRDFEALAEKIRECSLRERERRGIRVMAQV